jgi:hypothetical protein
MSGNGTYTGVTGCKYIGTYWNGSKHGIGTEEFGNALGIKYICPMGHRHNGLGYCRYSGDWERGYFHGNGCFECIDGRKYEGQWFDGKRHGKGTQTYLREGEAGDPDRLFIGGTGSLYRFETYVGEWFEGWKEGQGLITYVNGDTIEGPFYKGQPHGKVIVIRHSTGKKRECIYERGYLKEWLRERLARASDAISWLAK